MNSQLGCPIKMPFVEISNWAVAKNEQNKKEENAEKVTADTR